MTSPKASRLAILSAALFLSASVALPAFGDDPSNSMMIFPTSPFFTDAIRSEHINVVNNSETPATFRVNLIYEKQGPDGVPVHLESAPDPNFDLAKMLIYSPRQVFLQPGDTQTIKLAIRRPENMPEGEQRIYLKLTRMDSEAGTRLNTPTDGKSMVGRIGMQVGYAIPVIVRHGRSDAAAKMSDFKLVPPTQKLPRQSLNLVIQRTGKFSTMGRISVFWTPPEQAEKVIAKMGNVNVFPENNSRLVSVPLTESVKGGTLRILYDGGDDTPDKGVTFDEKTVPVTG
jgi:fimbrial chaperone protein